MNHPSIFEPSAPFSELNRPLLEAETVQLSDLETRRLERIMHIMFGFRASDCVGYRLSEEVALNRDFQYPEWLKKGMN